MPPKGRPQKKAGSSLKRAVRSITSPKQEEARSCSTSTSSQLSPSKSKTSSTESSSMDTGGYVFIHKSFWNDMCSNLACSSCGMKRVSMKAEKLSGLASKLIMHCASCGLVLSHVTSSPDNEDSNALNEDLDFEVNRRFVKFFVRNNKTYDDAIMFSKTLGIPCINKEMFEKYRDELIAEDQVQ